MREILRNDQIKEKSKIARDTNEKLNNGEI